MIPAVQAVEARLRALAKRLHDARRLDAQGNELEAIDGVCFDVHDELLSIADVMTPLPVVVTAQALNDVPQWLVVRKRDDAPMEVYPFHDPACAKAFFDRAQEQWTCTYLTRVVEAPGYRPRGESREEFERDRMGETGDKSRP